MDFTAIQLILMPYIQHETPYNKPDLYEAVKHWQETNESKA